MVVFGNYPPSFIKIEMKYRVVVLVIFAIVSLQASGQKRIALGGTNSNNIAIINRESKQVEWILSDDDGEYKKCNSIARLKGGNIAYTNLKTAKIITPSGERVFEYKGNSGEEIQSIATTKGGYVVGISGNPIRVVEFDKRGEVTKEITFDCEEKNIHRQFRRIAKTKYGSYVIPISTSKRVVEIDRKGEIIADIELDQTPLYASITSSGDWLVTCGHSGVIYRVDGKTKALSEFISGKDLGNGITIEFACEITELRNGNFMLANWVGHNGDQSQPILIELDKNGEIVWSMNRLDDITFVAGIYPF